MTKLCPRGKAAAKRKFKVYPSAYANAYASKICAGKAKDDKGVRRKDFKGSKPSGGGGTGAAARKIRKANKGGTMKVQKAGLGLMMLMNQMKKEGKKKGRQQAEEGMMQNQQYQNFLASQNKPDTTNMSMGGMVPTATGSYLKQDIDGDESFVNQSAIDYYKGMLD